MDYNLCTNHYLGNLLYAIFQLLTLDLQLDFQCAKMQLLLLHLGSLFPKEGIQMLYSLQYESLHIHKSIAMEPHCLALLELCLCWFEFKDPLLQFTASLFQCG